MKKLCLFIFGVMDNKWVYVEKDLTYARFAIKKPMDNLSTKLSTKISTTNLEIDEYLLHEIMINDERIGIYVHKDYSLTDAMLRLMECYKP